MRGRFTDETLGVAAAIVAVTAWGAASVLVKSIDGLDGLGIVTYRLAFGVVILVAVHAARGGRLTGALLVASAPAGVAFALDLVLFFNALRATSTANATVIGALQPLLLLPLGPRLFGERVDRSTGWWSAVAVLGTAVVVFGATGLPEWSVRGDLLALASVVAWTWYFVASKQARAGLGALEHFTGLTVVATVLVVPVALLSGTDLSPAAASDWWSLVVITVMSGALGHVLLNWAHGSVPLQLLSVITLLVPVVATTGAVIFLDESVDPLQVLGMIVVLGALTEVVRRTSTGRRPIPEMDPDGTPRPVA